MCYTQHYYMLHIYTENLQDLRYIIFSFLCVKSSRCEVLLSLHYYIEKMICGVTFVYINTLKVGGHYFRGFFK